MKAKHRVSIVIAIIMLVEHLGVAYISAKWGENKPINIMQPNGTSYQLADIDVQTMVNENEDLKNKISDYELKIKELTSQNEGLESRLNEAINKLNSQMTGDIVSNFPSSDLQTLKDSGIIWDILPPERLSGPDVRLPNDANPFIMSGQQCYGVCVGPSWDRYINTYLYLNSEFSSASFKIGHIDKTQERDIQVTILLDETVYEQPCTITYSEQPREFNLSGLDNIGTVVIRIDNPVDNFLTGPSYGITDICLNGVVS